MGSDVLVSVIVPVFGVEKYLPRCLDSLLAQDMANVEFLLIDDGSRDRCGEILDEYAEKDRRIRVAHTENRGVSAARNRGIDWAKGKYLMFVDADDSVTPDFCSTAYGLATEHNADMVVFQLDVLDEKGVRPRRDFGVEDGVKTNREGIDLLFGAGGAVVWNKIYRRELFEETGYPEGHKFEDQALTWSLMLRAKKIYYTNRILYNYFLRPDSISHMSDLEAEKDRFEMKMRMYEGLEASGYEGVYLPDLKTSAAMTYVIRVSEDASDGTGKKARSLLGKCKKSPKNFGLKKKVLFGMYKKTPKLFHALCKVSGKRVG